MSRSYKKNPVVTDGSPGNTQYSKRLASRRLRRELNNSDELLQGSKYKRHTCSYDIHDYKNRWSWLEAVKDYYGNYVEYCYFREKYPTLEDFRQWWEKYYLRK